MATRSAAPRSTAAVARLAALGGIAREIDFAPWRAVAAMLYEGPRVAERHAAIRAFFDAQPDALDPTVRSIVAGARRFSATDAFVAEARLADDEARRWRRCGATSTCWWCRRRRRSTRSPTSMAEPLELNRRLGTYTNFVNLLDLAALAVPAALRADGMPFGVTLIGPAGSDLMLADLAQRVHVGARSCRWARRARRCPAAERAAAARRRGRVVAVGAHLSGLPLNRELTRTWRAPRAPRRGRRRAIGCSRCPGPTPPKPGLVRTSGDGRRAIDVEVWELPMTAFGGFVAGIPAPLSIGTIELADGSSGSGLPLRSRRHGRRARHLALRRLAQLPRRARARRAAPMPPLNADRFRNAFIPAKEITMTDTTVPSPRPPRVPRPTTPRASTRGGAACWAPPLQAPRSRSGGAPAIVRAQAAPKIRIGFWPVAAGLPFFAAIEKGYFKEAGLDVEPLKFAGAQQVMEAMLSGRSDGSSNGTGSANLAIGEIAQPGLFKIFCTNPSNAKYVLDEFIVAEGQPGEDDRPS